jgi:hypothetical protein
VSAQLRRLLGAVRDRIALELQEDPGERPLRLRSEPARGALAPQQDVAGNACNSADCEREPAGQPDRAADLAGDEQQQERDERKQEPTDGREDEGAQRREPGGVRGVAAAAEAAVLDGARARRREELPREVRGEVRLASAPQAEAGQERPIHQRLGRNASEPQADEHEHLPGVELRERLPHLLVVDELRQQPAEDQCKRRDEGHGLERLPPQRPPRAGRRRGRHRRWRRLNIAVRVWLPGQSPVRVAWLIPGIEAVLLVVLLSADPSRLARGTPRPRRVAVGLVVVLVATAFGRPSTT